MHAFSVPRAVRGYWSLVSFFGSSSSDEVEGTDMLYSSGTTGRPKGVRVALDLRPMGEAPPLVVLVMSIYGADENAVYLSPAPLYHAAPLRFNMTVMRFGGTSVIMERFDAEDALALIERHGITHSQWVPTMFVRMLKLPPEVRARHRHDTLRVAITPRRPARSR